MNKTVLLYRKGVFRDAVDILQMMEILRNTDSPVSVTITRARSPAYGTCTNGKECLRKQARAKSADSKRRGLNSGTGFSDNQLLSPAVSGFRPRSSDRPGSARRSQQTSVLLAIPSITVSADSTNDYSDVNMNTPRGRSPSPFDWIARERLPCGSPTFEKVMSDMLSDTEISPKSSDTEQSGDANAQIKKKTSKRTSKTSQNKTYRNKPRSNVRV